jgi:hypothetical protein
MPEAFSMNSTFESVMAVRVPAAISSAYFSFSSCGIAVEGCNQLFVGNDFGRRKKARCC